MFVYCQFYESEVYMKSYKTTMYNENDETLLIHHSTAIVRHNHINKTVQLNNGGYFSKTTHSSRN